ncbi:MAG: hypothetical protein H6945_06420 [Zoogloeaceae bacterium]|nr:hypothetical protein [Zoogloeaceae bacterium]
MKPESVASLVSILGVVLTTASVIASVAQYRAADLQAQAAVVALMPQVEVRVTLEKRDGDRYTDRRIDISADGGPIYNFEIDTLTWFEVYSGKTTVHRQPLAGYYFFGERTGRTRGELYTLAGNNNHSLFLAFGRWFNGEFGTQVLLSEPNTLLRLSYRDALKRENTEYIRVSGGRQVYLDIVGGQKLWAELSATDQVVREVELEKLASAESAKEWVKTWSTKLTQLGK